MSCDVASLFQACLMRPDNVYICDGSEAEADELKEKLVQTGNLKKLEKMENW